MILKIKNLLSGYLQNQAILFRAFIQSLDSD